jgi:NAD(P) transhydrogenase subunit alpha
MYDEEARNADIVITTALIPGRPAPKLITADTVAGDEATAASSSTWPRPTAATPALTETDQRVVTDNGVVILGYTDLAGRLAAQTSQLYGTNIVNLLKLLTPEKDGELTLDMDDVVQRGITVTYETANRMWPPPPVQVSAAPSARRAESRAVAAPAKPKDPRRKKVRRWRWPASWLFALDPRPTPRALP